MSEFFEVTDIETVKGYIDRFSPAGTEQVRLSEALSRVLGEDVFAEENLPNFARSTMDGYAVRAASTFGASEANPAYLHINGSIPMGMLSLDNVALGEAIRISTGGALPSGADSVVILEHTNLADDSTIEVYKTVAPGQHVIEVGEDFSSGARVLSAGQVLRPQDIGITAAFGKETVLVYQKARVGIISTGDEVVPIDEPPTPGKIRDINSYTLSALVTESGGIPICYGIVRDDADLLLDVCTKALAANDMLLISGGSSIGTRDYTIEVFNHIPNAEILAHGIPISPGKPTILASIQNKPVWGLPGHVVSAMVVFKTIVRPFLNHINGVYGQRETSWPIPARMSRNLSSAQGRTDYIRVRLIKREDGLWAEPILGKSGLLNSMVQADGLLEIDINTEGLEKGSLVMVMPF
jgi:molybdopterin molybdotransferase